MLFAQTAKTKARFFKILITFVLLIFVITVVGYLKYGKDGGWAAVVDQFVQHPKGPILYSVVFGLFVFDSLSIISFINGLEVKSDEIEWDAHHAGSGEKIPSELKMIIYPFVLLGFLVFI